MASSFLTLQAMSEQRSLPIVVGEAQGGSAEAWAELVRRLERVVWKAVNMASSDPEVRNDAFGATWLRLAESLHKIREPEKLPGWLATTATNEVRRLVRRRRVQTVAVDWTAADAWMTELDSVEPSANAAPDAGLLRAEAADAVRRAFSRLDDACREILAVLVVEHDVNYAEAAARLGRPVGSLGPTRRRCLDKLRDMPELATLMGETDG